MILKFAFAISRSTQANTQRGNFCRKIIVIKTDSRLCLMKKNWISICFVCFFFRLSKKNVDCLFVHDFIVPNFALRWLACGCFSLEIYLSIYLSNSYRLGHKKLIFFAANSRWIGKNNFTSVTKCATHIFCALHNDLLSLTLSFRMNFAESVCATYSWVYRK